MQNVIDKLQFAFAALGGFLGWFFGGFDGFLYALIIFVVTDYFTGILAAGIRKELSSEVGFKGIAKKVCIFLLVGVANVIDTQVLQNGAAIRTAVIFFYLSNEGLSCRNRHSHPGEAEGYADPADQREAYPGER